MDRWRCTAVLLQALLCWTVIEHCYAGHRPFGRWERPRHTRHHDRWAMRHRRHHDRGTQRIEYPSVNDEGTQGLRYPSVHDRGQRVHYPSVNDSGASFQIQVKNLGRLRRQEVVLPSLTVKFHMSVFQVWLLSEGKGQFGTSVMAVNDFQFGPSLLCALQVAARCLRAAVRDRNFE